MPKIEQMKFRAVIFDLDGTLADTLEDIADNMNRVLAAMGFSVHGYDAYRLYVGDGLKNLVARCLPENARTDAVITVCHDRMVTEYNENYINKTRLYDGIPELLDELTSLRIKLAILSNKADLLKNRKFEIIMGGSEHFPRKPDPASALFIAGQMGVDPVNVCFLGDSDIDMKTAVAAGFYPIGVGWGFRPVEELIENGAKHVIHHPMELIHRLRERGFSGGGVNCAF